MVSTGCNIIVSGKLWGEGQFPCLGAKLYCLELNLQLGFAHKPEHPPNSSNILRHPSQEEEEEEREEEAEGWIRIIDS